MYALRRDKKGEGGKGAVEGVEEKELCSRGVPSLIDNWMYRIARGVAVLQMMV